MADVDPETLLEWLQMGQGDEREMQLIALEQLCMLLLMADNVDRCFESCPPRTFLPALCKIFLDECAPDNVLEVTARAITYYLDVSAECTRRIVGVDGAIKALCNRLVVAEMSTRASKDLSEQCIKVLELVCTRESGAVFEAGGLNCVLTFIREHGSQVHKDTLHSAMSVVSRLCGKMEPQDSAQETCVESLSTLLQHDDQYVADGALRCFASLADRFTRRGIDPAPLAKNGLTEELLLRLRKVGDASAHATATPSAAAALTPETKSPGISTVISLLSTLCRGSPGITHDLLRSKLPEAIDSGLHGDERCGLDTMRLVDLLLVLLFEGRKALPKSGVTSMTNRLTGLRRTDSAGERSHRQLIDCIRSKDTDALIDAIDNGFEVNFMDDVGQTLLNWASAFGTKEMVEFLCERGADVNRGLRSSSLHYAACFGRPQIVKTLLRYGANPDLRDEDGKTPLDKARERGDEGHRDVITILQSPGEWMVPVSRESTSGAAASVAGGQGELEKERKEENNEAEKMDTSEPRGDPEVAPLYVRRLLPVFTQVFHSSMLASVRKASLNLIRKMLHYMSGSLLEEMSGAEFSTPNFASSLTEVLATVLDTEEDDEGHFTVLQIMLDLMQKGREIFLEHFARLGLFSRVQSLAGPSLEEEEEEAKAKDDKEEEENPMEDAEEIVQGKPYHWKDWCFVRGRDCLYLWSDAAALELSNGSNGWFRFILDSKLATMYSSGSPEGGSDSSESRGEFLEKLQRARSQIKTGTPSQPILSRQGPARLLVGNWALSCKKPGEIVIQNSDGQQATILKEDLPGFIFESNRGTKHSFTAETSLGPEFSVGWGNKKSRKLKSKADAMRSKVRTLARDLYEQYFKAAEATPRGVVASLNRIVQNLEAACAHQISQIKSADGEVTWKQDMKSALEELVMLLTDEHTISSFELYSSGLVQTLLNMLCPNGEDANSKENKKRTKERVNIFKSVFHERDNVEPAVGLCRKLISALESIEKLPIYSYDLQGSGYGLQILTRRLRLRLERAPGETALIDRSSRSLKMEPLTTVKELERYLLKMVAKQWHDFDRATFTFVKKLKEPGARLTFTHQHDFDENGLIYWIGTNAKTTDWVNPAQYNLVTVTSSEGRNLPYGKLEDILSRDSAALNCHSNDDRKAWFAIDLGVWLIPSSYTLRHARGYGKSALRNWQLEVSKDGSSWTVLSTHTDDCALNDPGSTATWPLEPSKEEAVGWRHVRLQQTGRNASNQTHYLSLSGFEIYGTVTGVCDDVGKTEAKLSAASKAAREAEANLRRQRRILRSHMLKQMMPGARVVRGMDWKWRNQEGEMPSEGSLPGELHNVAWEASSATAYRMAAEAKLDLTLEPSQEADKARGSRAEAGGKGKSATLSEKMKVSVLTSRKSNSTPSLSDVTEGRPSVASTEQASSAENLTTAACKLQQAVESVAEGMVNRASSEAIVMVKVDSPEDGSGESRDPVVVVHRDGEELMAQGGEEEEDMEPGELATAEGGQPLGAEGGAVRRNRNRDRQSRNDNKKEPQRSSPTSLMSVSEPSLPTMEQASLLDSFAVVARRNLAAAAHSAGANMARNANTSSLVRLAISNNPSNLLSAAQSYPSLTNSSNLPSNTLTTTQAMTNATLSQALTRSLTSTSSESDNEFLETCRASTLMGELEDDDEELAEPDEDEDENEDDNEDDDEYDDVMEEDELESRDRRTWDDEFVLKRQFDALIPAFDPRPGRPNVNQTQDFNIPAPGEEESACPPEAPEPVPQPRLALTIKAPCLPGMGDEDIVLTDGKACIFKYVQQLLNMGSNSSRNERLRRIWEPTYIISYREMKEDEEKEAEPKTMKVSFHSQLSQEARSGLGSGLGEWELPQAGEGSMGCTVDHVLRLLQTLYGITMEQSPHLRRNDYTEEHLNIPADEFVSKKITNKIMQQIQDPLVLTSNALPDWCEHLTHWCPMLFPFDTRQLYFTCTAYGTSRAIVWLQNKRDASAERNRGPMPRRDDGHEFRVGRLKHERVKVPRGEELLSWAMQVMKYHGPRKAVLEIEFVGEEGTGLGPTLEFYALVAAELQRKSLAIWLLDDDIHDESEREVDIGHGIKPRGYYVQRSGGLFPAPMPQDSPCVERSEKVFRFLGTLLAKCLQDGRLIDLPLSRPFLKLMCLGEVGQTVAKQFAPGPAMLESWTSENSDMICSIQEMEKEMKHGEGMRQRAASPPWFAGILTEEDFEIVDAHRADFLRQLRELANRKQRILRNRNLTQDQKNLQLGELAIHDPSNPSVNVRLEDLGLVFNFNPSSRVYDFHGHDLKPNGEHEEVTMDNVEEYIDLVTDFCLCSGIRRQMEAFRAGFNMVFPLEKLRSFSPAELGSMLCGDQAPCWTREDILAYTDPKLGYTRESPGFQRFVSVLCELSADERKAFLQFTTGCSSLPPGGLANLHPRLTVVRKVDGNDNSFPSVNTCVHYLKLPEYSSEDILRERLLAATKEKGFHLN